MFCCIFFLYPMAHTYSTPRSLDNNDRSYFFSFVIRGLFLSFVVVCGAIISNHFKAGFETGWLTARVKARLWLRT